MSPLERPDRRGDFQANGSEAGRLSILYRSAWPLPHWEVDTQTIVILDFGSQYTQLIARRIRELNVFSVVLPCTAPLAEIEAYKPIGLILSGGPSSVYDADAPNADPKLLEMKRADTRHLLRAALYRASPGRQGAHGAEARVWTCGGCAGGQLDTALCRAAARDPGVDEPWGRGAGIAAGISPHGGDVECAGGNCE